LEQRGIKGEAMFGAGYCFFGRIANVNAIGPQGGALLPVDDI